MNQIYGKWEMQWGKKAEVQSAIADDEGNIIEDKEKILERYKQYFKNLLAI